jgi:1-acyl-sn-glycerol-3-phosphate acyltransferase
MRRALNWIWYEICRRLLQLVAVVVYRVRYSGQQNIPATGGVLVISNHQSHLDPPLVGIGCWRHMRYIARETLFAYRPFGWLLKSIGAISIDRDGFGIRGIKESLKALKAGEMVLIFPEGTRSSDGEIARFRPGITTLAVRSKAAILPVAIEGAFRVWPRSKRFPGLGRIRVHFGQPIPHDEIAGHDEAEVLAEAERRVHECHQMLRRQMTPAEHR